MVESALNHAKTRGQRLFRVQDLMQGLTQLAVAAYQQLPACDYPPILGRQGARAQRHGQIPIGLDAVVVRIGDTIRVSLSADPKEEVKAGFEMLVAKPLAAAGHRHFLSVLRAPAVRRHQDGRT
jgi:(E)-4-hydroxy-3-methylbut-2-enyl-diphosphate synthase